MVQFKKQHYVSQFYLKSFSIDRFIQIYDFKSKKFHTGPYNSVCVQDYFYSKIPEAERAFSLLENEVNMIINNIILNKKFTTPIKDYFYLLFFILFQYSKTG